MRAAKHQRRRSSSIGAPAGRPAPPGLPPDGLDPIIEAAAVLFETRGYDETTMGQVAERAGVGRQTVHARYGGKPGLLAAIVVEFCGGFVRHVLRRDPVGHPDRGVEDRATRLEQLARAMRDYAAGRGPLARVALAARELPWLARATAPSRREFEQLVALQFGSARPTREVLCLAIELLACVARAESPRAPRVVGEPGWRRVAELLPELAAASAAEEAG